MRHARLECPQVHRVYLDVVYSTTSSATKGIRMATQTIPDDKVLKNTLGQIEKQFGKGAIMQLGAGMNLAIEGIPTGCLSLDIALGGQGIPRGRVIELFGPESSGKTTLALHVMANAQKEGGIAAL